jgi:hypothetical protein
VICQLCGKSGHSAKAYSLPKTSLPTEGQDKPRAHSERSDRRQGVKLAARTVRESLGDDVAEAAFLIRRGKSLRRETSYSDEVIADSGASILVVVNETEATATDPDSKWRYLDQQARTT